MLNIDFNIKNKDSIDDLKILNNNDKGPLKININKDIPIEQTMMIIKVKLAKEENLKFKNKANILIK